MIKRPPFLVDNEEKLSDAGEPHKTHHHPPKGLVGRHHKKHDKSTTNESITKISTTPSYEKVSVTEIKLDKYSTTPSETSFIAEIVTETPVMTISSTVKPKKQPRRQKTKETSTNRTEIEDDKPQKRRKTHHHRNKNNTLFTNSIHDDGLHVNTTDATLSTRDYTTERHNYKFTTVPTTFTETNTRQGEIADVSRSNEDPTTESVTELETTVTITSTRTTEVPKSSLTITKVTSLDQSRNTFTAIPTTTSPVKRYPKTQKNRTSGILGPARIDVTILETPERKHKGNAVNNNIHDFN